MSYSPLPFTSKLFHLTALTLALTLAGCGGGGGGDTIAPEPDLGVTQPGTGGSSEDSDSDASTTKVDQIYISVDKNQLLTGEDSTTAEIRAIDKNGGIVAGVPVTISIDNAAQYGLSIEGSSTQTTDDNGLIRVTLRQSSVGIDSRLNHESILTVTANDGSGVEQSLPIIVSGTRANNVIASKNSVTATENFSISGGILDGQGAVLANTTVVLNNNGNEVTSVTTDNKGEFIFDTNAATLTTVNGDYNFSLDVKGNQTTQRISDLLTVVAANSSDVTFAPTSDIKVNEPQPMTLILPNVNDGEAVVLSTNKGKILNSTNDTKASSRRTFLVRNNKIVFYVESAVPGNATITAGYGNDNKATTINFVSIDPKKLLLQIERAVISTGGSTEVIAKVLDDDDAPVKNAIVQFTTTKDASGGSLDQAVAYTDNNGQAVVTYNAGQNPTKTDGVVIEAEVQAIKLPDGTEKTIDAPPPPDSSAITVQTKSTFISFSFANTVSSGDRNVYYYRKGSISVLNNTGKPAVNQQVSVNLIPNRYGKGVFRVVRDVILDKNVWLRSPYIECSNEDINNNGILDSGEDINNNGQLDPVNVVAVLDKDGNEVSANSNQSFNLSTDAFGKVDFSVRYPKEYAQWYQAKITVNTRVDGSESQQARLVEFPDLVDDVDIDIPMRPNMISPFGTNTESCTNAD
ncbi:hypothetical protein [Psychrobacter sp. ASPA161_9]|uniref:hypothetical protein n=1 Tax=Psychrobacter sp. ASPA161_9 TaxID=3160961 RepID=UPI003F7DAA18